MTDGKRFTNRANRRLLQEYEIEIADLQVAIKVGDRAANEAHVVNPEPELAGHAWVDSASVNRRLNKVADLLGEGQQVGSSTARKFTPRTSSRDMTPEAKANQNLAVSEAWAVAFASSLAKSGYKVTATSRVA